MADDSFILLPRRVFSDTRYHPARGDGYCVRLALFWLVSHANHAESPTYNPPLDRGELFRSTRELAAVWRVPYERARGILRWLEAHEHIETIALNKGEVFRGMPTIRGGLLVRCLDYDQFKGSSSANRSTGRSATSSTGGRPDLSQGAGPENANGSGGLSNTLDYLNRISASAPPSREPECATAFHKGKEPKEKNPLIANPPIHPARAPEGQPGGLGGGVGDGVVGATASTRPAVPSVSHAVDSVIYGGPVVSILFRLPPGPEVTELLKASGFAYSVEGRSWSAATRPDRLELLAQLAPREVPVCLPRAAGWSTAPELPCAVDGAAPSEEQLEGWQWALRTLSEIDGLERDAWSECVLCSITETRDGPVARLVTGSLRAASLIADGYALEVAADVYGQRVELDYDPTRSARNVVTLRRVPCGE